MELDIRQSSIKDDTVYCHFSFRRPKGQNYGLFAVAFYWDKEGKRLAAQATRKLELWQNHQFISAIQAYEHALYSIYTWQGIMWSKGIKNVMLVTDNTTLAGWIENPGKNKKYKKYMDRAVSKYRVGSANEITLSIGLCEVWDYEKSYKFCKEDKVINNEIGKTADGRRVLNLSTSNIPYKSIYEIEQESINKPEIIGMSTVEDDD